MTMRIPQLNGAMPHAYVEMHPEDAAARGIANGETIAVKTRRGELKLPVWINGRAKVPRGSLFIPFFDQRLLVNDLTLGEVDPISKEPDYKKCAATVSKVSTADSFRARPLEKTL
jgi:nitrate reductase NapA